MKNTLRKMFPDNIGYMINVVNIVRQIIVVWRKRRAKVPADKWAVAKHDAFDDEVPVIDIATGVYLRCILENGYETVIEVGTRNGKRIRQLKTLLPHLDCYGLDIQDNFKENPTAGGVQFSHNNLEFFKKRRPRSLVITRGCLSYYEPDVLAEFFKVLHENRHDLVFVEPVCLGESSSISRFAPDKSYYHPYVKMLSEAGFVIHEESNNTKFTYLPSALEYWHLNLARCQDS